MRGLEKVRALRSGRKLWIVLTLALAATLAIGVFAVGCGGDEETTTTSSPQSGTTVAPETTTTEKLINVINQ